VDNLREWESLPSDVDRHERRPMKDRAKPDNPFRLSAAEVEEIAEHAVTREFRARTVIVSEGDVSDTLYIIVSGRARAYVGDAAGREVVLSVMGPGEYFGEIAYDQGPRSASVITLEPCRMLVVPGAQFADFVQRSPPFALALIRKLIHHVRTLTDSVRGLALMDAYGRVARLLLELSVTEGGVQFVPERLTQTEVAGRVGCTREMVSRIFKDLVQGQYITLEKERIVINRKPPARW
jgi:CRP/FNR family transcriptional regulator, cyclic AMP receptor protein